MNDPREAWRFYRPVVPRQRPGHVASFSFTHPQSGPLQVEQRELQRRLPSSEDLPAGLQRKGWRPGRCTPVDLLYHLEKDPPSARGPTRLQTLMAADS